MCTRDKGHFFTSLQSIRLFLRITYICIGKRLNGGFSETIEVYDIKVGIYRKLNDT